MWTQEIPDAETPNQRPLLLAVHMQGEGIQKFKLTVVKI